MIVLTPYDVLCLKNSLGISSDDFLEKHTIILPQEGSIIPLVILKMNEDDKRCPFVSRKGCLVYEDRPWACRMYPLEVNADGTFDLITDASRCLGLKEQDIWKISDWMGEQGIPAHEEINELFSEVTKPLVAQQLDIDNPSIMKMIFMALYNIDRFRDFVFGSTFLDRFEVDQEKIKKIKENDVELLKFAFDWIKFGILGEKLFSVKQKS